MFIIAQFSYFGSAFMSKFFNQINSLFQKQKWKFKLSRKLQKIQVGLEDISWSSAQMIQFSLLYFIIQITLSKTLMEQFLNKEVELSERSQALNDQSNNDQQIDPKDIGPCQYNDLLRFSDNIDKILMFFGSIFSVTNGVSIIFYAAPLGDLINAFNPASDPEDLVTNIGHAAYGFFLNGLLVFASCCLMTIAWTISSQRQLVRIRKIYYETLLRQELKWYDKNRPEQICSNMYVQTQRAQNTIVESVTSMLTCLSMGISSIIISFVKGWKLALVLNSYIPVIVVLNYLRSQINLKAKIVTAEMNAKMSGDVFEVFSNIKTVKYLGGQDYELDRYTKDLQDYRQTTIKLQRKMAIIWSITAFCSYASVFALGFWYGCKLIAEQVYNDNTGANYNIGDVISIFFCMYISAANFNPLSGHFANLSGCRIAFNKIIHIIQRKPRKSYGFQQCLTKIDQIQFKNVSFQFNQPLFRNFNLVLKRGVIALIGSSGNGKSTLLNLLVKFYQPAIGNIILSNDNCQQKLVDIEENSLRSRIGYVGQEPVLLGRTFREILLAEEIEDKRVWEVLDMCCISDFVKEVGLNAPFKAVSGGQKQRLAIARAILRNPQILILDQGTSALDSINEKKVLKNLRQKSKISFILMIAHRLQTLAEAGQIFKITKGQVQKINPSDLWKEMKEIEEDQRIDQGTQQTASKKQEKQKQCDQRLSNIPLQQQQNSSQKTEQKSKSKFKWAYFRKLLSINKKYKSHYIIGILSAALLGAIFPSLSVIITNLIAVTTKITLASSDIEKEEIVSQSQRISIFLFVVAILNLFMIIFKDFSFIEIGQNLIVVLKKVAFKTAVNMKMTEIEKHGKNHLVHTINTSTQSARNLVSQTISSFVDVAATLLVGLTLALLFCWQITVVAFLLVPLCAIAGMIQNKFLTQIGQNSDKILRNTHEMVLQSIVNNRTIASLNLQTKYIDSYGAQQNKGLKIASKNAIYSGLTQGVSQMLIAFVVCLICYLGALLTQNFNVSIASIFSAIYAVMFSGVQAGTNIQFIGGISTSLLRTTQFFEVVDQNDKELEEGYKVKKDSPYPLLHEQVEVNAKLEKSGQKTKVKGLVQFKDVYFRYPQRKDYLFKGLSFTVEPKQRIAIVGQSGTGKTSVADLLLNIYEPEQGQILIDSVSTANYAKRHITPQFAIVSQEPALFNRPIRENIEYNLKCSLDDIKQAAKTADAYEFIQQGNFGSGYHKVNDQVSVDNQSWNKLVGSKGSLLSGGQKQRVALARAVIRKPVLMVMDEATSALDKETEEKVLQNIDKIRCTQIVIAHRLSTIKSCDRIIVLKEGKIAEMGTYEQLVNLEGEFAKLAKNKKQK